MVSTIRVLAKKENDRSICQLGLLDRSRKKDKRKSQLSILKGTKVDQEFLLADATVAVRTIR